MKKLLFTLLSILLIATCLLGMCACENKDNEVLETAAADSELDATGLWAKAKYRKDTTVGDGGKTVKIDVEADGKKITITLKTDKATLGEAMYEYGLLNDPSFFDVLNGIKADWNKDQAYWAFYEGENYMTVGVNDTKIKGGEHYRFVYSKS